MKFNRLMLEQLDEQLRDWDVLKNRPIPKKGWVNMIRLALGLSTYQLAKRMNVYQSRVVQIEEAERKKAVTLKTLEKAAEAMGCKLVYGLIPCTTLHDILERQAKKVAKRILSRVTHTMELEEQGIDAKKMQQQFEDLIKELLEGNPKKLWSEDK